MNRNVLIASAMLLTACSVAGAQARSTLVKPVPGIQSGTPVQPSSDYVLHLNDALEIQLPFSPEYNEGVTIQPDGFIGLREAKPVSVAGKTVVQAEAAIIEAYKGILKDPTVHILLKGFLTPSFYASGEVGRPGRIELRSDTTLLQALTEAGGLLNERAAKKQVVVFRPQGGGTYVSQVIDVKELLKPHGAMEDYAILPGDIIYVPQNRVSKIQKYIPTASAGAFINPF